MKFTAYFGPSVPSANKSLKSWLQKQFSY